LNYIFLLLFLFSAFSSGAQTSDTPLKGEGIYAFLRRHNYPDVEYYDEFIRLNEGKFGKDNTLLKGVRYQLPAIGTESLPETNDTPESGTESISAEVKPESKQKAREPLFGKLYENYEIEDQVLAGACYFLVSGHGGPDPGTTYRLDGKMLHEDEYAYDIMLRIARNLLMHGAKVYIIIQDAKDGIRDESFLNNSDRETCMGEVIPLNQEQRLKQRCNKINSLSKQVKEKYRRAIFIHMDSRSKSRQTDIYFYHTQDSRSMKMSKTVRNTFQTQYELHQPGRGFTGTISYRNLYVLRNSLPVSLYVEVGNIRNPFDQKRFMQSNNRQALANWFLKAFIADYQNSN
jgi:N-acetylmuramoyl-L-alanine amidase